MTDNCIHSSHSSDISGNVGITAATKNKKAKVQVLPLIGYEPVLKGNRLNRCSRIQNQLIT
eukprot:6080275-Ditylum_brightwellii.AAC.1